MTDRTATAGGAPGCAAVTKSTRKPCKRVPLPDPDPDGRHRCDAHSKDPKRVAARRARGATLTAHNAPGSPPAPVAPSAAACGPFDLGHAEGCTDALSSILNDLRGSRVDASTAKAAAQVVQAALAHHTAEAKARLAAEAAAKAASAERPRTVLTFELAEPEPAPETTH